MLRSIIDRPYPILNLVPDRLYLVGLRKDEAAILCVWHLVDIQRIFETFVLENKGSRGLCVHFPPDCSRTSGIWGRSGDQPLICDISRSCDL